MRRKCIYFNSSILIRAVNPREPGHYESLHFISEALDKGYLLVVSSVHLREGLRADTLRGLWALFRRYGFVLCDVDVALLEEAAVAYVRGFGYSDRRVFDVMHMLAARECGCRYIAAVDRFIWAHAREFGLKYINYYTGIP